MKILFILFASLAVSFPVYATNKELNLFIHNKIKELKLNSNSLGLIVSKVKKGDQKVEALYKLNENRLFTPASLVKIPVLSALYNLYPPSYTFKTTFVSSAPVENGVLKGDLFLKGGGDSSFTSESLFQLVNILTRSGIKKIEGHLIIDDSLYSNTSSQKIPSDRSYYAPYSASSFNWNSVAFYIRPGQTLKQPAFVYTNPQNSYIKVINKTITGTKNKISVRRKSVSKNKEVFEVKGFIDIKKDEIVKYRNVKNPPVWLGYNVLSFLKQRDITLSGKVKKGVCKGSCKILAEWESRPLLFHSYNMMKYSSNFVTNMLVTHLPLLENAKKGDVKQGVKKINQYLIKELRIKNFKLVEASGLDRKNKFSPKQLQKILAQVSNKHYSPEILASYPLSGRGEGTLERRFKNLPSTAFVRAKTGSLYGVQALAGWAGNPYHTYIFVFVFNGKARQTVKVQTLFEEILLKLIEDS